MILKNSFFYCIRIPFDSPRNNKQDFNLSLHFNFAAMHTEPWKRRNETPHAGAALAVSGLKLYNKIT